MMLNIFPKILFLAGDRLAGFDDAVGFIAPKANVVESDRDASAVAMKIIAILPVRSNMNINEQGGYNYRYDTRHSTVHLKCVTEDSMCDSRQQQPANGTTIVLCWRWRRDCPWCRIMLRLQREESLLLLSSRRRRDWVGIARSIVEGSRSGLRLNSVSRQKKIISR